MLRLRPRLGRLADRLGCALAALLLLGFIVLTLTQARQGITPETATLRDFGQDYLLARAFEDGIDPYVPVRLLASRYLQPTGLLARDTPTPHPPSVALLILPLTLLDYTDAVRVWFLLQSAAVLLGVYLTLRSVGQRWAARLTPLLTLVLLLWPAVDFDLGLGQSTSLLLALLAATQLALVHGRTRLAGLALGVSLLLKPLAWPWVLVLAWRRLWSGALIAVLIPVFGWTIPAVRFGVDPIVGYFSRVLPTISALYSNEVTNLSWWTLGPRLFRGTSGSGTSAPPMVDSPAAATVLGIALPILVLGLVWLWLVLARPGLLAALSVFLAIALLVSPISWAYYLVLALLPAAYLGRALPARGWPTVPTLAAVGSLGLLALVQDDLIHFATLFSAQFGAPDNELSAFGSMITLAPSIGVAGLAAVVAWCDRRSGPRQAGAGLFDPDGCLTAGEPVPPRW